MILAAFVRYFHGGWLVLEGDELKGMFYFHLGDDSGIVLKRANETAKKRKK